MKKKLNLYVVEDMAVARMSLVQILKRDGHNVVGSAANVDNAVKELNMHPIDLVLLDVNLRGNKDGIWLGNYIRENYNLPFVFLTAYGDQDTLDRILKTKPNGYLMKPYDKTTLITTITIAYLNFMVEQTLINQENSDTNFFIFTKKGAKIKIYFKDILWLTSDGNYLKIKTKDNEYIERLTLKQALEKLPEGVFAKINKSQIVNTNLISSVNNQEVCIQNEWLPISRNYKKKVLDRFNNR